MQADPLKKHISQQFDTELEDIRNRVLAMGGLVEKNVGEAILALVDGDAKLGEVAAHSDYQVNRMEIAIDEECAHILARRQPTAIDLRLVMAVIKTIADLERVGDKAEKIARVAVEMASQDRPGAFKELRYMGDLARGALHKALDAFARMDVDAAMDVVRGDDLIDEAYKGLTRQLITYMMEDPRNIRRGIDVLWCARALERVGDHSKNISEYVVYLVCGKDVRHTTPDEAQEEIRSNLR
ncbi:phosphate signaling complex protein PhoU [Acidihalobacter ferrooxydans]|uniref:Phosphate-specific transport system accessory protein PhoU n=1 Tax=Acidihalobacter ferrooxydans TaxID=1765967 RepID=A0A1P8UDB0_9GAMM|nr:phosphate signaling complex protein PhoU [Acidihalobacter ferrooxydans]APZ41776.1 phosphate transport system regulatory protein PhoU [Acidihalobacter ferrooxydans]